jgi:hypothetical protein
LEQLNLLIKATVATNSESILRIVVIHPLNITLEGKEAVGGDHLILRARSREGLLGRANLPDRILVRTRADEDRAHTEPCKVTCSEATLDSHVIHVPPGLDS